MLRSQLPRLAPTPRLAEPTRRRRKTRLSHAQRASINALSSTDVAENGLLLGIAKR